MSKINKAVVLAGGRGTRLRPFTDEAPKPMFPIQNKPFLEYLLKQIKCFGINEVIILVGYLPDVIRDYFRDGSALGINIRYSVSDMENETQKRIWLAKELIADDFLLMYCDNYCPVDFEKMREQFFASRSLIQLTAYTNRDFYTKNNVLAADDGEVTIYDKSRTANGLNSVDIGYALVKKSVLDMLNDENVNFEKNIYQKVLKMGKLSAYLTDHRYYSIGSYERIALAEEFFSGLKIVFLDRDGTINRKAPKAAYITRLHDFEWLPGAKEAVRLLNENGYFVILVTNQPGIARGALTEKDLEEIHGKMINELKESGAKIDKIYVCIHNWDDGCECRKPRPGMLFEAQREFNFNMRDAVFFGDDPRDMEAAEAAGCAGVLVSDANTLLDAVKLLIKSEGR